MCGWTAHLLSHRRDTGTRSGRSISAGQDIQNSRGVPLPPILSGGKGELCTHQFRMAVESPKRIQPSYAKHRRCRSAFQRSTHERTARVLPRLPGLPGILWQHAQNCVPFDRTVIELKQQRGAPLTHLFWTTRAIMIGLLTIPLRMLVSKPNLQLAFQRKPGRYRHSTGYQKRTTGPKNNFKFTKRRSFLIERETRCTSII